MPSIYRVTSAFLAVKANDGGSPTFITVPSDTLIEVRGKALQSGMVEISFEGQVVAAFMRDIEDRATPS